MNSNQLTKAYFDRIVIKLEHINNPYPDTTFTLWGQTFSSPIGPCALSHQGEGMLEISKAAASANTFMMMGMNAYDNELTYVAGGGAKIIKIIKPYADDKYIFEEIDEAKRVGAIAVGMDTDHSFSKKGGFDCFLGNRFCNAKTVEDLRRYKAYAAPLPFVVKGVLSEHDAWACLEAGVDAIVVSHHHGRVDNAIPPLAILPRIKAIVGDKMTVFIDCGYENGGDVFKALALGADAVCLSREMIAEPGKDAIESYIRRVSTELWYTMAHTGCGTLADITPDRVEVI